MALASISVSNLVCRETMASNPASVSGVVYYAVDPVFDPVMNSVLNPTVPRQFISPINANDSRGSYTLCDGFYVTKENMPLPLRITRTVLQCFGDLPMAKTAELLGICKNSLTRMCQRLGMGKWPYTDVMRGSVVPASITNDVRSSKTAIVQHRYEVMGDFQRQHDPQAVFLLTALQAAERDAVGIWRRYGQGVDAPWLEELCRRMKKDEKFLRKKKEDEACKLKLFRKKGTKGLLALKAFKEGARSVKSVKKPVGPSRISLMEDKKEAPEDTLSMEDYKADVVTTSEVDSSSSSDSSTFWPLITDQFNFCALLEDTEDVLGLGPVRPS